MIPGGPFGGGVDAPQADHRWRALHAAGPYQHGPTALLLPATQPFLNHDFPTPQPPRQPIYDWQSGSTALTLPVTLPPPNYDFPVPPRPRLPAPSHTEGATSPIIPPYAAGSPFAVLTPFDQD